MDRDEFRSSILDTLSKFHLPTYVPKPCPFCGSRPDKTDGDFCYPITRDLDIYRAGCIENAGGCGAEVFGASTEEACAKWNTRVESDK